MASQDPYHWIRELMDASIDDLLNDVYATRRESLENPINHVDFSQIPERFLGERALRGLFPRMPYHIRFSMWFFLSMKIMVSRKRGMTLLVRYLYVLALGFVL